MPATAFTSGANWSWWREGQSSILQEEAPRPRTAASDEWTTDEAEDIPTPTSSHSHTPPIESHTLQSHSQTSPNRHYTPRTCRICLEVVPPTFELAPEGLSGMLSPAPRVQYISQEPESGRLIRPCKCKGTQRYVHEGCLQEWRHADPEYGRRNYWECPTCKFRYRLERMRWSRWISSTVTQILLTLLILFTTIFILGFVADPIISLYIDPFGTLTTNPFTSRIEYEIPDLEDEEVTWAEHILKGLASLGLLGFIKVIFAMSPMHWFQLRNSALFGGGNRNGRAANGRDRLADISWWLVIAGVLTFLYVSCQKAKVPVKYTTDRNFRLCGEQ